MLFEDESDKNDILQRREASCLVLHGYWSHFRYERLATQLPLSFVYALENRMKCENDPYDAPDAGTCTEMT